MKLLEGEKIIIEAKPLKNLLKYRFLTEIWAWFILPMMAIVTLWGVLLFDTANNVPFVDNVPRLMYLLIIGYLVYCLLACVYVFIVNVLRYNKMKYWITNKRIILKRGLIGDVEKSILIERLGEVDIVQTWFQGVFGISMLKLEILGKGQRTLLAAFPNAKKVKQDILELISKKRKAEKLAY